MIESREIPADLESFFSPDHMRTKFSKAEFKSRIRLASVIMKNSCTLAGSHALSPGLILRSLESTGAV